MGDREELEREAFVHLLRLRQALRRLRAVCAEEDDGAMAALVTRTMHDDAALLNVLGQAVEASRERE